MKKLMLLFFLIVLNSLLDACGPDEEACFTLDISSVQNILQDNYQMPFSKDTIQLNNYAINLIGETMDRTCLMKTSFGGRLMADVFFTLSNRVSSISITSSADLNSSFPAGSELKSLFIPVEIASHCVNDPGASSDCIYDYFNSKGSSSLEEVLNDEMAVGFVERPGGLRLFAVNTAESIPVNSHQFTIRIEFQNGQETVLTTEPVVLR